jgi:multidrug resistance protein, MATE family
MQCSHTICELDLLSTIAQLVAMASTLPPVNHITVLKIAVPIMLSNVTEPMIGVVNTAVVGQLPNPALIGGVAVGGMIFAFLFWGFGFLRLSTSGLSAQATGAGDNTSLGVIIGRSLLIGLGVGAVLLAISPWLGPLAIKLMGGSIEVQSAAMEYFSWRIFSAPAALANFAILGWLIGQSRATTAFIVQIVLNLTNMAASMLLVLHYNWQIAGVGCAALVAEYVGLAVGLVFVIYRFTELKQRINWPALFNAEAFRTLIATNTDIMIRTLCLLFAFSWFIARGARNGDTVIAANAVLMNFFEVAAYSLDGFAYAAEAMVGQSIGARDQARYSKSIKLSGQWAMAYGALASLVIWFAGPQLIDMMTVNEAVRETARHYLLLAAATPLLGAACFLYDGIFTGALATREMRNMMIVSLAIYLASSFVLEHYFANAGLWIALNIFLAVRSVSFASRLPAIKAKVFA